MAAEMKSDGKLYYVLTMTLGLRVAIDTPQITKVASNNNDIS